MNWLDRAVGYVAPQAGLRRARQRAALAALARSYEGARLGRRTEGWVVAGTGANTEIGTALPRLRDRSRDLVRNNPYAAKAAQAVVSNLVGTGILPRARSADVSITGRASRDGGETTSARSAPPAGSSAAGSTRNPSKYASLTSAMRSSLRVSTWRSG